MIIEKILDKLGLFKKGEVTISEIHQGLINHTWKIDVDNDSYIFQRVNTDVFKRPEDIAYNIGAIAGFLHTNLPEYFFVKPLPAPSGNTLFFEDGMGYYRAFPFVKNSHSKTTVKTADEAFEAARQFARFTAVCSEFDASTLRTTIPDFHNLSLRFSQFLSAVSGADSDRKAKAAELIRQMQDHAGIVQEYQSITRNPSFKIRVTHHDTKISNVLFDENNKGICVIDLDTVMPGLFISDVGDMMRTYLSPVSEEESDFEKITVRSEIYQAIVAGYMSEMGDELTAAEKNSFFYAGCFMIYMQALRFLTDYLNGDIYYHPDYPLHNFNRAENQMVLLDRLLKMETELKRLEKSYPGESLPEVKSAG